MNDEPSNPVTWNLRHPAQLIGTGFGVGLLPKAPGTWGSLAALPFAWLIVGAGGGAALAVAAIAAFAVGIWASEVCLKISGDDDPKPVVIDEICGQWLVLAAVPNDVLHYALGFALFRFFDILKPWPVSWADREIKGGLGIMIDDVLAAGYAGGLLFGISNGLGI